MTETCGKCDRPMARVGNPPGFVKHIARGYCRSCYATIWKRTHAPKGRLVRGDHLGAPDPVVVHRVMQGERLRMNRAELDEVVEVLTNRRQSTDQIARLIGCSPRTVTRHRARVRDAA